MPGYATSANTGGTSSGVSSLTDTSANDDVQTIASAQLEELKQVVENGKALLLLLADAYETSSSPNQYLAAAREATE